METEYKEAGYLFLCSNLTQKECFQRMLFGISKKRLNTVREIKTGSTLFLYNMNSKTLIGPFIAASEGGANLVPEAWTKTHPKGFPAQVYVNWKNLHIVKDAENRFQFLRDRQTCKLTPEQTGAIQNALNEAPSFVPSYVVKTTETRKPEILAADFSRVLKETKTKRVLVEKPSRTGLRRTRGEDLVSEKPISMKEIEDKDLREFLKTHKEIMVGKIKIKVGQPKQIKEYQPEHFELESINAWSFPKRGKWATHKGNFRGNWPPQMARNVILRYSKPGEIVLDQMCGSGTTLIECKLLARNGIGVDINPEFIMLTRDRLDFEYNPLDPNFPKVSIRTYIGDARNLNLINDESIDLIATHPPYANIISYSSRKNRVSGDLSFARSLQGYLEGMREIASESYRVLKPGRFCGILVGDTRRHRHHVPIAFRVMQAFLDVGFILREDIMKYQWQTKSTREKWAGLSRVAEECWVDIDKEERKGRYTDFLLLFYEHLFIFRKPEKGEDVSRLKGSMRWWSE